MTPSDGNACLLAGAPRVPELDDSLELSVPVEDLASVENRVGVRADDAALLLDLDSSRVRKASRRADVLVDQVVVRQELPGLLGVFPKEVRDKEGGEFNANKSETGLLLPISGADRG